jgi:hypothetical protein
MYVITQFRIFFSFYVRIFNLRSCHLRLALGRTPQCQHIIGTHREDLRLGLSVQYLNTMTHGQNLSSTSGEPEFVAQ